MPLARRLSVFFGVCAVLFAMVSLSAATSMQSKLALSEANQRCLFSSVPARSCTPLRSCRTCLNANLAAAPCFLDARGLCLSMDRYDAPRTDSFVAANTTYCAASDPVCTQCLQSNPASGVCTGREGACVCLAVCESETWESDAKAAVGMLSGSAVASPSVVNAQPSYDASHTSLAVVVSGMIASVVVVALLATAVRRRCQRPKSSQPAYNLALTPTAVLSPKALSGRV